jgi:hypothetical protein
MKQGFLQALGVAAYCTLVGLFMWNANHIFGQMNNFFGPILILILLCTSALICGLIVFLKPYKLFFAGKKKEAVTVVISTTAYLFLFLLLFLASMLLFR